MNRHSTMADAELKLRNLLEKILNEKDYIPREITIKVMSTDGANMTSTLLLADVTSPDKDDLKLFGKVASIGKEMRKKMNAEWLFENEKYVYTELVQIYEDIQNEYGITDEHRFVFPKYYGHNSELCSETIVLENLMEKGYKSYNRFKSIDWNHARVGVQTLAKFHALSFAFYKHYPDKFEESIKDKIYRLGCDEPEEGDKLVWETIVQSALSVIKEKQKVNALKLVMDENWLKKLHGPTGTPVLCHGDYRPSNILFNDEDNEVETMVVDFQTLHAGCPVGDLIYYIFLGSDEQFRFNYYDKLLDHYYNHLVEALLRLSVDPIEVYPREKFDNDMKELLPCAVIVGAMVLPVVTVDAELSPKTGGDAKMSNFAIEPNKLFTERFNGIVNDCFRLGAFTK